ncbi:MAG: metallophosphoesterase [Desulfarculus sp.]|jgi:putative phosphoesterase|nr:MAG: metallophosphoesterase [Desulfarculus sp.]
MRIGVLADTHLREVDPAFAEKAHRHFADVDMILHAGDLTSLAVLEALEAPQVLAVCGNMDGPLVAAQLPVTRVVQAGAFKIGLIHGWGSPVGLAERVSREFSGVDAVVFGHAHLPTNHKKGAILLFNPGSVAKGFRGSGTAGILEVGKEIAGRIFTF